MDRDECESGKILLHYAQDPIAQRIEHLPSKQVIQVRFLVGSPLLLAAPARTGLSLALLGLRLDLQLRGGKRLVDPHALGGDEIGRAHV